MPKSRNRWREIKGRRRRHNRNKRQQAKTRKRVSEITPATTAKPRNSGFTDWWYSGKGCFDGNEK